MLASPIPAEANATCDACAMVVPEGESEPGYNPSTKCCTFLPDVWNFLAGAVLLDDSPESARGRATVEARIDHGVGITPLGLRRTNTYRLLYHSSPDLFGHSLSMRCPHYIDEAGGLCGVWRHRESTCTTWFCKFVRGSVGREFWTNLHQLLRTAEESLSAWCLLELGVDQGMLALLYPPFVAERPPVISALDIDGEPNAAALRELWGKWHGRERDLYRECATLVARLTWSDVLRIGGAKLDVFARLTHAAHERLTSDALPELPTTALVQISPRGKGRVRLATYSGTDALEVPAVLATILAEFDGRPIDEALEAVRKNHGVSVGPSLVRKLTDFGVLRDARIQ